MMEASNVFVVCMVKESLWAGVLVDGEDCGVTVVDGNEWGDNGGDVGTCLVVFGSLDSLVFCRGGDGETSTNTRWSKVGDGNEYGDDGGDVRTCLVVVVTLDCFVFFRGGEGDLADLGVDLFPRLILKLKLNSLLSLFGTDYVDFDGMHDGNKMVGCPLLVWFRRHGTGPHDFNGSVTDGILGWRFQVQLLEGQVLSTINAWVKYFHRHVDYVG